MAGEQGFTLWFTGLSGAGKTTISKLVVDELEARGSAIEVLDGDVVRQNLSKGLGFSKEDRDTNIRRVAFVADLLSRNGVPVITAAISPYRAIRDEARAHMDGRFIEAYVKASVEECERRPVREGAGGRDQGVHRGLGPVRAARVPGDRARDRGADAGGVGGSDHRLPRRAQAHPTRAKGLGVPLRRHPGLAQAEGVEGAETRERLVRRAVKVGRAGRGQIALGA